MTQHKPVLTNEEMHALICGNPFTLGLSVARLKDFIRQVEKAVIDKLAEQEPVVYRFLPPDTQQYMYITDDVPKIKEFEPLYAHPPMLTDHIPDVGKMAAHALRNLTKELQSDGDYAWSWHCNIAVPIMDSTGLSHREANIAAARLIQHLFGINTEKHPNFEVYHIADASKMVECAKCCNPAIHHLIMDNIGHPNKTPLCGDCTQEHEHLAQDTNEHEIRNFGGAYGLVAYHYEPLGATQPDHIADMRKKVPDGWQLVPKEPDEKMRTKGGATAVQARGAWEDAAVEAYKAMLAAAPKYTGEK